MPDELYWNLTLREVETLVDRHVDESRNAARRTAAVIAAIYNVHRKPGSRAFKAADFIKEPPREEDFMTVDETRSLFNRWAKAINAEYEAGLKSGQGQERLRDE